MYVYSLIPPVETHVLVQVKGTVPAVDQVKFEEYDVLKGDAVELPNHYVGAVSKGPVPGLEGTFKDNQGNEGRWNLHVHMH